MKLLPILLVFNLKMAMHLPQRHRGTGKSMSEYASAIFEDAASYNVACSPNGFEPAMSHLLFFLCVLCTAVVQLLFLDSLAKRAECIVLNLSRNTMQVVDHGCVVRTIGSQPVRTAHPTVVSSA
jgi:hypothetical protein